MIRTYDELVKLRSFDERFDYLRLSGVVGHETFGSDRYLNQKFYSSREWREVRLDVLARDFSLDLGVEGHPINGRVLVHHMNPLRAKDLDEAIANALDPNYLITVSHETHNALHYGDTNPLSRYHFAERRPGDTILW